MSNGLASIIFVMPPGRRRSFSFEPFLELGGVHVNEVVELTVIVSYNLWQFRRSNT